MFGRHRLEEIVTENASRSAEDLVDAIFTAVSSHAKALKPSTIRQSSFSR